MPSRQPLAEGLHNHPPRCCCEQYSHGTTQALKTCPACPEHGDLAQGVDCPYGLATDCGWADCPMHGRPVECPSCHTHAGHPHTDYCTAVAPADYPGQPDHCTYPPYGPDDLSGRLIDTCRPVEVDGEIIRVHGAAEMNDEDRGHFTELVRAVKRRMEAEGR